MVTINQRNKVTGMSLKQGFFVAFLTMAAIMNGGGCCKKKYEACAEKNKSNTVECVACVAKVFVKDECQPDDADQASDYHDAIKEHNPTCQKILKKRYDWTTKEDEKKSEKKFRDDYKPDKEKIKQWVAFEKAANKSIPSQEKVQNPPSGGQTQPSGGQTQPSGGQTQPSGGQTQPSGGQTPPQTRSGEKTPSGEGTRNKEPKSQNEELTAGKILRGGKVEFGINANDALKNLG